MTSARSSGAEKSDALCARRQDSNGRRAAAWHGERQKGVRESAAALDGEFAMLDLLMLIFGVGMFVCFVAYTAVCDKI
jgi:hypothetical protein